MIERFTTETSERSGERRAFVMHENLLRDVIQRQAGTVDKAILEGVMNLIEAGAKVGHITIAPGSVTITDDGAGFRTKDEIVEAFEVFGKSDERKAVAGQWAEFQMGRGQLMSFGRTTYRSHTFEMRVDLHADPSEQLGYELLTDLPDVPGCRVHVELAERLDEQLGEIDCLIEAVTAAIRYVAVPVYINGTLATRDPKLETWTFEDDFAYYRTTPNDRGVDLYNLGVVVTGEYYFGVGGVIVSKKRLTLNFARNNVMAACPTWQAIRKAFTDRTSPDLLRKKSPSARDTLTLLRRVRSRALAPEMLRHSRILRDTNGRRLSPHDLTADFSAGRIQRIAFDKPNAAAADHAMHAGPWLVLDEPFTTASCEELGAGEDLLEHTPLGWVLEAAARANKLSVERFFEGFVGAEDLYRYLDFETVVLVDERLSQDELTIVRALRAIAPDIARACRQAPRRLNIGIADGLQAWTDGNQIVVDRDYLKTCYEAVNGILGLLITLMHEYAHDVRCDEHHDAAFFERFHDGIRHLPEMLQLLTNRLSTSESSRKNAFARSADREARIRGHLVARKAPISGEASIACPACAVFPGAKVPRTGPNRRPEVVGIALSRIASLAASRSDVQAMLADKLAYKWFDRDTKKSRNGEVCPLCRRGTFPNGFPASEDEVLGLLRTVAAAALPQPGLGE